MHSSYPPPATNIAAPEPAAYGYTIPVPDVSGSAAAAAETIGAPPSRLTDSMSSGNAPDVRKRAWSAQSPTLGDARCERVRENSDAGEYDVLEADDDGIPCASCGARSSGGLSAAGGGSPPVDVWRLGRRDER